MSRATLFAAVTLLIAACGSSRQSPTAFSGRGAVGRDVVSNGIVTHRPYGGTGGNAVNDDNPGGADTGRAKASGLSNPCRLVSEAEAQAIIGRPIAAPQEAPLGPTCIYQPLGTKSSVTLAIESIDFAKVRSQIRNRTRVMVAGRTAYCGVYGQPTTFVPLPGGRVLNITAQCAVGTRFATKALPRLKA